MTQTSKTRLRIIVLAVVAAGSAAFVACKRQQAESPKPPSPAVTDRGAARTQLAPVAPRPAPDATPPKATPPQPTVRPAEVEMTGRVVLPPSIDPKLRKVMLYVAARDCLDPRATVHGATPVSDSTNFFSEVFVPQGTDLSLCAAVDEGDGKPAKIYGRLGRTLHAAGEGEVMFSQLVITLKAGRPHVFRKK